MRNENGNEKKSLRTRIREHLRTTLVILLIILAIGAVIFVVGIRTVPSGFRGVKTQWGSVVGLEDEGFHWVNWILGEDIVNIDTQIHNVRLSGLSCGTSDMQEVTVTVAINYYLDKGFISEIYKTLRTEWESRVILSNMRESLKGTTASFKAEELLSKRETVKVAFLQTLSTRLAQYHIVVSDVQMEDYQFSPAFSSAIESKATAEQNALEERNKLDIVKYQQEQEIIRQEANATMAKIQAEAYANVTLTQATANAQRILIEATSQAEALRVINAQLTSLYLKYMALETWNGELPYYYGGDLPIPFLDVSP